MMKLSLAPLRRPLIPLILFLLLAIVGMRAFFQLKVADMPQVDEPDVVVFVSLPGATPSQLEAAVVTKIEDGLASLDRVGHITARLRAGSAEIHASFSLDRPPRDALADVRDLVNGLRASLPPGVTEPVVRLESTSRLLLTYAVEPLDGLDAVDATTLADTVVGRALSAVPGVDRVARLGGSPREVRIALDPARLAALRLPADEAVRQIRAALPGASGGAIEIDGRASPLAVRGVTDLAGLARLAIRAAAARVTLGEIATIEDTVARETRPAYFNGKPVIALSVFSSSSADEVALAARIRARVDALNRDRGAFRVHEISSQVDEVEATYRHSMNVLDTGCLLAVAVVWLFLRDLRATLIAALSLPLSILPAFIVMRWSGYSLNTITLLALTLVIGVLIDDAIVEVENIVRHLRHGTDRHQAIATAVGEIALTVLATSLALVAIFLPTAFLGGVVGRYFWQFGWTASIAVLSSLLVARLLIPVLALGLLRVPDAARHRRSRRAPRRYLRAVVWCMRHAGSVLAACAVLLGITVWLFAALPRTFLPPQDSGVIDVTASFAPGSAGIEMADTMRRGVAAAAGIPEIASSFVTVGTPAAPYGEIAFTLVPAAQRQRSQAQIASELRTRLAPITAASFLVDRDSAESYRLVLTGDDASVLDATAQRVMDEAGRAGLNGIASSESAELAQWLARPDSLRAGALGVGADAIDRMLRAVAGDGAEDQLPYLQLPNRQLRVRTMVALPSDHPLAALGQLPVATPNGSVPLGVVASIERHIEPAVINRYDRRRNVTLYVPLGTRALGQVGTMLAELPSMRALPAGVARQSSGDAEFMSQLFGSFFGAMLLGVAFVYLMLVTLFNDPIQPLTILVALPLSVGGALGGLFVFGYPLSLPAVIGLLTLLGLVAKNSILLVEYAVRASRHRQVAPARAALLACRDRVRPVVMTSCAMLGGMLPLALNLEADNVRAQMALTVVSGLVVSTALSLLFVPVFYVLMAEFARRVRRLLACRAPRRA
ncbi:efflux RND transporter permease subunit [Burkholderia gladioli]|uniref:efflux RND transporter permease subunit n=1 Tax=Burkholderia gladioli TaxID=28095 RepID=UPI001640773F|nr:efflux RND transporter permease subunit [Burkholderia gladioli]